MSKVYDCFLFYDEFDLLEIRLHELAGVVDYHVLCESVIDFRGNIKPLYFWENGRYQDRFAPFLNKIIYVVMDSSSLIESNWGKGKFYIEQTQRDYMGYALGNCVSGDIIILSDADEIIRPDVVERFLNRKGQKVEFRSTRMQMYIYYYNLLYIHRMHGAVIMTYNHLMSVFQGSLGHARQNRRSTRLITNGGWHFSCIGGYDEAARRLKTNSHSDRDRKDVWENLRETIEEERYYSAGSGDRGKGGLKTTVVPFDSTFPKYMLDNIEKYQKHIK